MMKFAVILLLSFAPVAIYSQAKPVAPPPENAPATEQQKWLTSALQKYASYTTPTKSVKISGAKIQACVLSFTQSRKFGSSSEDTLIITTRTDTVKDNVTIDLAKLDLASVKLADHIFPELSTLTFRTKRSETSFRDMEMVVQKPAADSIKTTLERLASSCQPAK